MWENRENCIVKKIHEKGINISGFYNTFPGFFPHMLIVSAESSTVTGVSSMQFECISLPCFFSSRPSLLTFLHGHIRHLWKFQKSIRRDYRFTPRSALAATAISFTAPLPPFSLIVIEVMHQLIPFFLWPAWPNIVVDSHVRYMRSKDKFTYM